MMKKEEIKKNIDIIVKTPSLESIDEEWEFVKKEFCVDEKATLEFLEELSDIQRSYISPMFEELSIHFQSQAFVDGLKELDKKYPKSDLSSDVASAQMVIED